MKIKAKFEMFVAVGTLLFLSLPVVARSANSPHDQATEQTQSAQKGKSQKAQPGPGKEVGKGGEDIGKGAGKGAESLGKGTAGAAASSLPCILATPPPISEKAPQVQARTSESALEKARPRSAKEAPRE
jgi:hypothetical protein